MSLFLGKIHYWLYNKVLNYELIEKEIINWAKDKGLDIDDQINRLQNEYGAPLDNRPLEEIIDTSNIHGWLQNKISMAEIRQASLITNILNMDKSYKEEVIGIFKKEGAKAAQKYIGNNVDNPQELYQILNDVILEGMPCDNVSQIVDRDEIQLVWDTTMCLHKPYWDKIGGDVKNFYDLRDAWINSFINTLNQNFNFERLTENSQRIVRL